MVTPLELVYSLVIPIILSSALALLARWRRWRWMLPLAAGCGFLAGYALLLHGVPRLPPRDGSDWLFWLALPLMLLGVIDAILDRAWGWMFGLAAGGVSLVILLPILPGGVSMGQLAAVAVAMALAGLLLVASAHITERCAGSFAALGALCIATGGAAVVVLSSGSRIGGIYGLAAAAAVGPAAVLCGNLRMARPVAVVSVGLLVGILTAGRFYAEVTWAALALVLASPLLAVAGSIIPARKLWIRAIVALLLTAIVVSAVAGPAALAAKKAAEGDAADLYK